MINAKHTKFIDKSFSQLEFNKRVLSEAANKKNLLTGRLKFLSISSSNLDEFYMVQYTKSTLPEAALHKMAKQIKITQQAIWNELKSEMSLYFINIIHPDQSNIEELPAIKDYFANNIKYHTKIIDKNRILTALPNLRITALLTESATQYKIILPHKDTPQLIQITEGRFIFIEDMLKICTNNIIGIIKCIRDTNIYRERYNNEQIDEQTIKRIINNQYRENITDIQLCTNNKALYKLLQQSTSLKICNSEENFSLSSVYELIEKLQAKFVQRSILPTETKKCFHAIDSEDILIHHPYQNFEYILNFLRQAAEDPDVISIKQTIYRTEKKVVDCVAYAAQLGKKVTVIIESRARFDEINNIKLAEYLRKAGVKVILNISGIKIHSKFCLIAKKHAHSIKYYLHYSTGNYSAITAATYQDLSILTTNQELCSDIEKMFHYLTKEQQNCEVHAIYVSPFNLRNKLIQLIEQEIRYARSGAAGNIWMKCNAITDRKIINLLYRASQKGVKIFLMVRGICLLKPGIICLSENIKVRSIIGEVLEHSRIYCFGNGNKIPSNKTKIYISSADLMERNFDRRIEAMVPIKNSKTRFHILNEIMTQNIFSSKKCWEMQQNGTYNMLPYIGQSAHEYFFARYI